MKSVVGPNITMGPKSAELTSQNVTVTRVKATLGRKAIIRCWAENLVGQKTVSELNLKQKRFKMAFDPITFTISKIQIIEGESLLEMLRQNIAG